MSEPKTVAKRLEEMVPGILRWEISDERIGGAESDAYAILAKGTTVLVDPLPLAEDQMEPLRSVKAICLTGSCHQRSAWGFRRRFGGKVYAPRGAEGLEEAPDVSFRDREELPGGLLAMHTPGPTEVHYSFLRSAGGGTLFCADLLTHIGGRGVGFIPDEFQDDPKRTRETVRALLEHRFETLCFAHGSPILRGAHEAIRKVL